MDVSGLDLNDVIHVSDLTVGEGVEIQLPGERTICSVSVPRVVVEAAEEGDDEGEEPELVGGEEEESSEGGE